MKRTLSACINRLSFAANRGRGDQFANALADLRRHHRIHPISSTDSRDVIRQILKMAGHCKDGQIATKAYNSALNDISSSSLSSSSSVIDLNNNDNNNDQDDMYKDVVDWDDDEFFNDDMNDNDNQNDNQNDNINNNQNDNNNNHYNNNIHILERQYIYSLCRSGEIHKAFHKTKEIFNQVLQIINTLQKELDELNSNNNNNNNTEKKKNIILYLHSIYKNRILILSYLTKAITPGYYDKKIDTHLTKKIWKYIELCRKDKSIIVSSSNPHILYLTIMYKHACNSNIEAVNDIFHYILKICKKNQLKLSPRDMLLAIVCYMKCNSILAAESLLLLLKHAHKNKTVNKHHTRYSYTGFFRCGFNNITISWSTDKQLKRSLLQSYTYIISRLKDDKDKAKLLFDEAKELRLELDSTFYEKYIAIHRNDNNEKNAILALNLLDEVQRKNIVPHQDLLYKVILVMCDCTKTNQLLQSENLYIAMNIIKRMSRDTFTHLGIEIINALLRIVTNDIRKVQLVIDLAHELNLPVNFRTRASVYYAIKLASGDELQYILDEAKDMSNRELSRKDYNHILSTMKTKVYTNKADEILKIINDMENSDDITRLPSFKTYITAIEGLLRPASVRTKNYPIAVGIYEKMKDKGLIPSRYCYHILIDACFKRNQPEEAITYYNDMKKHSDIVIMNMCTYQLVLEGLYYCNMDFNDIMYDLIHAKNSKTIDYTIVSTEEYMKIHQKKDDDNNKKKDDDDNNDMKVAENELTTIQRDNNIKNRLKSHKTPVILELEPFGLSSTVYTFMYNYRTNKKKNHIHMIDNNDIIKNMKNLINNNNDNNDNNNEIK